MEQLIISPFRPENQTAVKTLILNGLVEHWGFLDGSKNPDLDDIASSYRKAAFLVAWLDKKIVGTGAYIPRSDTAVEIVRMSVAREVRRQGIGGKILTALCQNARQAGYQKATLETTKQWKEVVAFYRKFGFRITHYAGENVYFSIDLSQ